MEKVKSITNGMCLCLATPNPQKLGVYALGIPMTFLALNFYASGSNGSINCVESGLVKSRPEILVMY